MKTKKHYIYKQLFIIFISFIFIYGCGQNNSSEMQSFVNSVGMGGGGTGTVTKTDASEYYKGDDFLDSEKISENEKKAIKTDPTVVEQTIDDGIKNIKQKLIKTANIECELEDYQKSKDKIYYQIKKWGAYISDENEHKYDYQILNSFQIRVPVEQFDSLVEAIIKGEKAVKAKHISVQDVTAEYVDVFARLKNKKREEEQYLEILKKAYTINDILQVNNYIYAIREEIEAGEGHLKFLDDQSSYSTIYLSVYQNFKIKSEYKFGFFSKIAEGLQAGWYGTLSFFVGLTYI